MNLLPRLLYPLYEARLWREISAAGTKPKHVAIMCDGNRRWAKEAGFADVTHGHRVGARKINEMVHWSQTYGIDLVTVYLLSTENLGRKPQELVPLFDIIVSVVDELVKGETTCRVRLVGALDVLPEDVSARLKEAIRGTEDNTGVSVNIAVGYGGRQEIVDAARAIVTNALTDGVPAEDIAGEITVDSVSKHLYTSGQPDPDLVIRTSGEQRLSGFLLWQSAYSEIWFTDTYWPAFRKVDFLRALRDYTKRSRRFGK